MLSEYFDKQPSCNFSEAFDEIFNLVNYASPSQEEQTTLRKLLESLADIRDNDFVNDLSILFSTRAQVQVIRQASHYKQFRNNMDVISAFRILKQLHDSLEDTEEFSNIKAFLRYLLFEPIAVLRDHVKQLKSMGFKSLNNTLKSLLPTIDIKLFNGETPCMLSFICNDSTHVHELFRPEYKEAEFSKYLPDFDANGKDYFELMIESAYESVNEITIQQGSGSMVDKTRNERNIDIINKLSPHWSHIMTTSATASSYKKQLKNIQNDISVNVNDGLDIFLGNYNLINNVNVGSKISKEAFDASKASLILYQDKFDRLSKEQQNKVVTFLAKYRPIFNKICVDTVGDIFRNIERAYNAFGNKSDLDTFRSNMFNVLNKQLNNSDISNDLSSSMVSLFNSYARTIRNNKDMLITDKVSWCCSFYAPIVNRLSQKISSDQNLYVKYKQYYEKSPSMAMFPIMPNRSIKQSIIGGSNDNTVNEKVVYVHDTKPIIKERIVYVNGGDNKDTSTSQYIKSVIDGQTEFNRSFETIYRDLIKSVFFINPSNKVSMQSATLNNCVYALRSIEIDSPKTSYKISGFYPAKNWNKHYVNACYKVVGILEKEGNGIFDETIGVVKKLISLCEESARKAQDILGGYMTSSRTSSELFYNLKHVGKIECRLSKQELNRYAENLRKLESSLLLLTKDSTLYSLDTQMKKFAGDVQSRADLIRDYFKNKSNQLRLNGSFAFNNDRFEMLDQFNTQVKNCMLYINDKLDIKLASIRTKKEPNFDAKIFDKFEKAMIMFKDVSNNQQLLKILERLHIVLFGSDFETKVDRDRRSKLSLELIQIIQKFWKESGYIDFIIQLYTEFNIFDDGFNWSEFRDNISLLLALVNITVSTKYNLECTLVDDRGNEIASYNNNNVDTVVEILDLESLQDIARFIAKDFVFRGNRGNAVTNYKMEEVTTAQNTIITALQQMLSFANSSNDITGKSTALAYREVDNAGAFVANGIAGTADLRIRLFNKRYNMSLVDQKKQANNGEVQIAMMVFDAMLANVLDIVNKYTTIKYTGNFRLPLQISNLVRGGDNQQVAPTFSVVDENGKVYGGNVFDILSVNDNNFDTVIVDAVPFYISAFNIIVFYYKKYGSTIKNNNNDTDGLNTSRLFFEVPKLSPLYPIVSKIQSYNVDSLRKLNAQMIKCGIGVFNGYWRKAEGSTAAEKLSNSIDMILNEVNACMVYSSKLQFDALKVTGTLPSNFLQNLSSNINNLTDALKKSISESVIDLSMSRTQQTEVYESMMKSALERVRSKGNSEEEKVAELINIIVKTDESNDSLNEVYKFIDLGVMPLYITLMGYNNIFSLYNIVLNIDDSAKDVDEVSYIDLDKYMLNIRCSTGLKTMSVWQCINELQRLWRNDSSIKDAIDFAAYKQALDNSSIVTLWNTFAMFNNIYDIVNNGASYKITNGYWFTALPKTYPTNKVIRRTGDFGSLGNNIKLILYQLYPYISGRNLYDYFIATCGDFASDIDHCLHMLLAYPNVNDKFIASISSNVHKFIDDKQTLDERFNISSAVAASMRDIDMSGDLGYIKPPPYKHNYYIPQYTEDNKVLQSMSVLDSGDLVSVYTGSGQVPKFINIDGYAQNIVIQKFNQSTTLSADYTWTDWVIQRLADCDTTFGCIPSKLIMKLQEYDQTRKRLRTLVYDASSVAVQSFDMRNMTSYVNPITSNIVTRSLSKTNVEKTKENGMISQQWISNLVGLIPYIINKIKAYYSHVSPTLVNCDVNLKAELNALNAALVSFYNDLITFAPRIGYMENTNIFSNNKEYHAIAEIVPYLKAKNIETVASSELAKFSWANKYFFGSLSDLIFPEYKEYDRFDKIKDFAKNIFSNTLFANEFDTVIGILAKAMVASSIILGEQQTVNALPIYTYYNYILKTINYGSELIVPIHEKFVNNVIRLLRNERAPDDNYGFANVMQGGNARRYGYFIGGEGEEVIEGTLDFGKRVGGIIVNLFKHIQENLIDENELYNKVNVENTQIMSRKDQLNKQPIWFSKQEYEDAKEFYEILVDRINNIYNYSSNDALFISYLDEMVSVVESFKQVFINYDQKVIHNNKISVMLHFIKLFLCMVCKGDILELGYNKNTDIINGINTLLSSDLIRNYVFTKEQRNKMIDVINQFVSKYKESLREEDAGTNDVSMAEDIITWLNRSFSNEYTYTTVVYTESEKDVLDYNYLDRCDKDFKETESPYEIEIPPTGFETSITDDDDETAPVPPPLTTGTPIKQEIPLMFDAPEAPPPGTTPPPPIKKESSSDDDETAPPVTPELIDTTDTKVPPFKPVKQPWGYPPPQPERKDTTSNAKPKQATVWTSGERNDAEATTPGKKKNEKKGYYVMNAERNNNAGRDNAERRNNNAGHNNAGRRNNAEEGEAVSRHRSIDQQSKVHYIYSTLAQGLIKFDAKFIEKHQELLTNADIDTAITTIGQILNCIQSYKIRARFGSRIEPINVMSASLRSAFDQKANVFDVYSYLINPETVDREYKRRIYKSLYVNATSEYTRDDNAVSLSSYQGIANYNFNARETPIINLAFNTVINFIESIQNSCLYKIENQGRSLVYNIPEDINNNKVQLVMLGRVITLLSLINTDRTHSALRFVNIRDDVRVSVDITYFIDLRTTGDIQGDDDATRRSRGIHQNNDKYIPPLIHTAINNWTAYIYGRALEARTVLNKQQLNYDNVVGALCCGFYCALLHQSMGENALKHIIRTSFSRSSGMYGLQRILRNMLCVVFVKSFLYSTSTVFKNCFETTMFRDNENDKNYGATNVLNANCFKVGVFPEFITVNDAGKYLYETNEISGDLLNQNIIINSLSNQPILSFTPINLLFLDTSSIVGVYGFINPVKEILNASAVLLNSSIGEKKYAYRGGMDKLLYAKFNGKNYLLNAVEDDYIRLGAFEIGNITDPMNNARTYNGYKSIIDTNTFINNYVRRCTTAGHTDESVLTFVPSFDTKPEKVIDNNIFISSIDNKTIGQIKTMYPFAIQFINVDDNNSFNVSEYIEALGEASVYTLGKYKDSYNTFKIINQSWEYTNSENGIKMSMFVLPFISRDQASYNAGGGISLESPYGTHDLKVITPKIKEESLITAAFDNNLFSKDNPITIGLEIISKINESITKTSQTYKNTGFSYSVLQGGNVINGANVINGGVQFDLLDDILKSKEDIIGNITPAETYKNIYVFNEYTRNNLVSSLYTSLFKYGTFDTLNVDGMFAIIVNYFHKYSVSFSSIYNQVIFPSILYNAAVYGTLAEHYSNVLKLHDDAEPSNKFTKFIQRYFSAIEREKDNKSFFNKYYDTIERGNRNDGRTHTSYNDMAELFREPNNAADRDKPFKLADMPSINNNLLKLLYKHNFVKYNQNFDENRLEIDKFCGSSLICTLKRIDAVETFSFVILMLSKYMSYYNIDTNEDVPYTGSVGPNPFGFDSIV